MKSKILVTILSFLCACGAKERPHQETETDRINKKIAELQLVSDQISALVSSEFKTCDGTGATTEAIVLKICKIAKASTIENNTELLSQLREYASQLNDKITTLQNNVVSQDDLTDINNELDLLVSDLYGIGASCASPQPGTLCDRLDDAESAITAVQNSVSNISNTVNAINDNAYFAILIGSENLSAGPVYESLLRKGDKTTVVGYATVLSNQVNLLNNPLTASNGSPDITVSQTAHGYSINDVVIISGCSSGRGLQTWHINSEMTIVSASANSYIVTAKKNATGNGTFGGASCTVKKVLSRGMSTLRTGVDLADTNVRTTSAGSAKYNFIIKKSGSEFYVCYDVTTPNQTFVNINTNATSLPGTNGNYICK